MTGPDPDLTTVAPTHTIPPGARLVTPDDEAELSRILSEATRHRTSTGILGGGTHRGIGHPVVVDQVVTTARLSGVVDWQPEDLTVVARAGTKVADLEAELNAGGQTALLPEHPGDATVGGVVAAGVSSHSRLRYGPTRDRVLEIQAVTGDGRTVKGGGRVVKNVTGFDLPRLFTGSLGVLGVITAVCLKLWPRPEASATVRLAEVPPRGVVHRPLAVLETPAGVVVHLAGTAAEVAAQASRLGGHHESGLVTPHPPSGEVVWSCRIRPKLLTEAISLIPPGSYFVAQHGVGEVSFAASAGYDITDLRTWVERAGGRLVRVAGVSAQDPWGTPPDGLDIQQRLAVSFDPARILEPGRLPGGW